MQLSLKDNRKVKMLMLSNYEYSGDCHYLKIHIPPAVKGNMLTSPSGDAFYARLYFPEASIGH